MRNDASAVPVPVCYYAHPTSAAPSTIPMPTMLTGISTMPIPHANYATSASTWLMPTLNHVYRNQKCTCNM